MLYQFMNSENTIIATKATPNWMYLQKNGCYGLTTEFKAQGVAINGTPYHLEGRGELPNLETVSYKQITEEEYEEQILVQQQKILDIITGESEVVAE